MVRKLDDMSMLLRLVFRFGFRSDLAHDASLEDKAERLRRKAEDEKDNVITEVNVAHEMEIIVQHPENDAKNSEVVELKKVARV